MKNIILYVMVIFILGMTSCQQNNSDAVSHKSHEPKKAEAPYSDVVEANGFLFLSGQIGMDHSVRILVEGGIEAETKQCIENIKAVLEAAGTKMSKVVKTTVFLLDMNDFGAMNGVYGEYFTKKFPARSAVQVARLPKDGLVEIEAIAMLD